MTVRNRSGERAPEVCLEIGCVSRNRTRVLTVLLALIGTCALSALGQGTDLPESGLVLVDASAGNHARWLENPHLATPVQRAQQMVIQIDPANDPYAHREWRIQLPGLTAHAGAQATLVLEYFDEGAGLLEAQLVDATTKTNLAQLGRRSNYTRLNTGQFREAWFAIRLPRQAALATPELAVTGLDFLRSVRLLPEQSPEAWEKHDHAVPREVQPMVVLDRPMELVTTAGVDVRGEMTALDDSLVALHELAPLARVLGFTAIESYVSWKRIEPEAEGEFDFFFYDAITDKLRAYDLKWFPLLIVGSGYALPDWFRESDENIGFVCLEHGLENDVQSIWSPHHARHVERVLKAFGDHYEPTGILEGVRLGPSGNYGESQYPAGGNWGPKGQPMHIHIGWWAGDPHALTHYRAFLQARHGTINALNQAWDASYPSFEQVAMELPTHMRSKRQRIDFTDWYTDSMTAWCEYWAKVTRAAMPNTVIHQSAGGWGFRESGTDYSAQTKSMTLVNGGIRLTNETDSFEQNYYATRLAVTAALHYGAPLGYEPASSHTARGTVGRIFNHLTTNAQHFFTYHNNLFSQPMSIDKWLQYASMLDMRQNPLVEVAVYYPETFNQLEDSTFRHLYAWGFNPRAAAVRRVIEVNYLDERLIREGYLDRYKTLVFAWGDVIESDVLEAMDAWMRRGGVITYPSFPKGMLGTVEGDTKTFARWMNGDTGAGAFHRFRGDMEPTSEYAEFVKRVLLEQDALHPWTQRALRAEHPGQVFLSIQQDGHLMILNYEDEAATVRVPGLEPLELESYGIARVKL